MDFVKEDVSAFLVNGLLVIRVKRRRTSPSSKADVVPTATKRDINIHFIGATY
jgi:hypothetical protein